MCYGILVSECYSTVGTLIREGIRLYNPYRLDVAKVFSRTSRKARADLLPH